MLERVRQRRRRVRRAALPHRPLAVPAAAQHLDARRSPRCTAGSTCPTCSPSTAPSPTCRWSRSPTTSGCRCRRCAGSARSTTACRRDLYRFSPTPDPDRYLAFLGRISPEKRPDRAIEIATRAGMPLKIAAKVDNADRDYWQRRDRAAGPRQPAGRVRRRDRRAREGRLPRRRHRAALPDRLARAVRPGDDRGDGLRHAGDRLPLRLGPRGDRPRRHRLPRRRTSTRRSPPCPSPPRLDRAAVRATFERALLGRAGGRRLPRGSTSRSAGAADRSARARPCRSPPDAEATMTTPGGGGARAPHRRRSSSCPSPPRCRSAARAR